jgi:hypothetical protein
MLFIDATDNGKRKRPQVLRNPWPCKEDQLKSTLAWGRSYPREIIHGKQIRDYVSVVDHFCAPPFGYH